MLNYANLNDVEFEYLCQDIMQKKLNIELHKFARGKDGGIDLTDNVHTKNIVIQVKHYMNSSTNQLITSLSNEVEKVSILSPKEYYVCCSKELSPQKVDEIYQLFSDYMTSPSNIITLNEIDTFLNDPANIEILKKHYKLWIESTRILQEINNTNVFIDCETLLSSIESEKNLFVITSAFTSALKCLEDNKSLFITGNPGVGKTITSKMLVLHYAASGYKVRFSTNVSDLDELKKSLSRNPDEKEIILVDDCFGQAYFNMKESQNTELLSLINFVNASSNKLLILNSRITIFQEAKERKPELLKCFEGNRCKVYVLDMSAISDIEKAKILYNHIFFNGIQNEYFSEIKKNKRYFSIIKHPNYTPRIVEFICNPNRYKDIPPDSYYDFIIQQLNNPKEIWKDEYERRLEKVDRLLLLTLYSLSDSAVDEQKVKACFERRISLETDIDTTINQYDASLSRLMEGFVQLVSDGKIKKLKMVNPSVNDYIDGRLNTSELEKQQLVENVFSIQQKKRLLSESDFNEFVQSVLRSHEIEKFIFDDEAQKNAFITYFVCKSQIKDELYIENIKSFLNAPIPLYIDEKEIIYPVEIFQSIFQTDNSEFYRIGNLLTDEFPLKEMLDAFSFNDMIEVILMLDHFYTDDYRNKFIEISSNQLLYALEEFCSYIDADEYEPDVFGAVDMSHYFNGLYEDIDISKAAGYLEDEVISDVESDIDIMLSKLPEDIANYQNYTENLKFTVYGAEDLINSYYDYDGYDYDDYRESHIEHVDTYEEIDYIFERN